MGEGISHQASLLVSILVRYPEIGSVRFLAADEHLAFTFMLKGMHNRNRLAQFRQAALAYLDAYTMVTGHTIHHFDVNGIIHNDFTQVEICRDMATVSREELSLLIGLIRTYFGQDLVVEYEEPLRDEDRMLQEELIDDILEDVRAGGLHRELVGFREAGRVMVFNKNPESGQEQSNPGGIAPQ